MEMEVAEISRIWCVILQSIVGFRTCFITLRVEPVEEEQLEGGWIAGIRVALGVQGMIILTTCLGYGALARETGLGAWVAIASTGIIWALPSQLVFAELYLVSASGAAILFAVMVTNMRFLPMVVSLMPIIRGRSPKRWQLFLAAQFVAVTPWAVAMRDCPKMPEDDRLSYMIGMGGTLWLFGTALTGVGYLMASTLPSYINLGLVFLIAIYWMLLFIDIRQREILFAVVLGAIFGPLIYLELPQWSLMLTGFIGGTIAFFADEYFTRRELDND